MDLAIPKVEDRLKAQREARDRLYGHPCQCVCNCRVLHRFGSVCVLCRGGDHYEDLDSYLTKIKERAVSLIELDDPEILDPDLRAEHDYYRQVDKEN